MFLAKNVVSTPASSSPKYHGALAILVKPKRAFREVKYTSGKSLHKFVFVLIYSRNLVGAKVTHKITSPKNSFDFPSSSIAKSCNRVLI